MRHADDHEIKWRSIGEATLEQPLEFVQTEVAEMTDDVHERRAFS